LILYIFSSCFFICFVLHVTLKIYIKTLNYFLQVRGHTSRLERATQAIRRVQRLANVRMTPQDQRRITRVAEQLSILVREFRDHHFIDPPSETEEE
jgi:hypothetical protein